MVRSASGLVEASVPRLYTIAEAAQMFGVSKDWWYDEIRAGRAHVTDLANNADPRSTRSKWRLSAAEMHRVIAARTASLGRPA